MPRGRIVSAAIGPTRNPDTGRQSMPKLRLRAPRMSMGRMPSLRKSGRRGLR